MSNNLDSLKQIISINDNTDDLLEQKIKENEKVFENLEINKSNDNSQKKENSQIEANETNQKIVNEYEIKKNDINNTIENMSEIKMKDKEKTISNENTKNNDNIELLTSRNDNSIISSINNHSSITNKTNEKKKISKRENKKIFSNPSTLKQKGKNNFKKINNYNNPKREQQNKNRLENQNQKRKILKDNVDLNLYTQYTSLYSTNNRKNNNSIEKRNRKRNETDICKSQDKSKDKSRDKSSERFKIMYDKVLENEKRKKENIKRMKLKMEEEEKKIYIYKPRINERSKEIVAKNGENKEDFYSRQKKMMEQYKKNEDYLREKIMKEKDDKIKNSVFSIKYLTNKDKSKDKFKDVKSRLFDWEEKQKNIVNNSSKKNTVEKEESDSENNKAKYKIKVNRNINRIINRLYKNDLEKRKHNLEILNKVYTPSFQPTLFENKNVTNKMRSLKTDDKLKNNSKSSNIINPSMVFDENIENEIEERNLEKNDITHLLRNKLFNKNKKKARYRSAMKFKVINDENIYEIRDENNIYEDIPQKSIKYPKASSSFVKKNKKKHNI